MFVTIAVVLCHSLVAQPTIAPDRDCTAEESKIVEVVTDTDKDPDHVDFMSCSIKGQEGIAEWKEHNHTYAGHDWRIARVMCIPGHYEPPGRA